MQRTSIAIDSEHLRLIWLQRASNLGISLVYLQEVLGATEIPVYRCLLKPTSWHSRSHDILYFTYAKPRSFWSWVMNSRTWFWTRSPMAQSCSSCVQDNCKASERLIHAAKSPFNEVLCSWSTHPRECLYIAPWKEKSHPYLASWSPLHHSPVLMKGDAKRMNWLSHL